MERKYPLRPDPADERDYRFSSPRLTARDLPKVVDLSPQMSPVVDQGSLGSCTSNAIVSGLREHLMLKHGEKYEPLSRLYHYWHERELEGTITEDAGAYLRDGMKVITNLGACPEALYPYVESRFTDTPTSEAEKSAQQYRISSYHRIFMLDELKAALADGKPVVIGIAIYQSFHNWNVSFDGLVPLPDKTKERSLGGHAMLVVGFDDSRGLVKCRNSWGADWGDHGYCFLPYDYIEDITLTFDMWVGEYTPVDPWEGVSLDEAVRTIAGLTYQNGAPVSDSPDYWLNFVRDNPDNYFGLLLRKIAAWYKQQG